MGYKVAFKEHIESNYKWTVEVMQKPESTTGFIPQKTVDKLKGLLNGLDSPAQFQTKNVQRCGKNNIFIRSYDTNCIHLPNNQQV